MKLSLLCPSFRPSFLDTHTYSEVRRMKYNGLLEFIMLNDNNQMTIGKKMEVLTGMSTGQYIMWMADDDILNPRALPLILDNLPAKRYDGLGFNVIVYPQVTLGLTCRVHPKFTTEPCAWDGEYQMRPWHPIVPTRRDLYENLTFPDKSWGEDHEMIEMIIPHLDASKWNYIDEDLYLAFPRN